MPDTVGVMMRRSVERRAATTNFKSEEMTTRLAIMDGPPSTSAVRQMAIAGSEVPMTSMWPAPNRPMRRACSMVVMPHIPREANTVQVRYASGCSAVRTMMTMGTTTSPTRIMVI